MAKFEDFDMAAFREWLADRPTIIKELGLKCPPDRLYRFKHSGTRLTVRGYQEDGTLIINVSGQYNRIMFERDVFGVPPEDIEECDFPPEDEEIGVVLTDEEEVKAYLDVLVKRIENDAKSK